MYVVFDWTRPIEAILLSDLLFYTTSKKLSPFAFFICRYDSLQWLELSVSRINVHSPNMFEPLKFDCASEN